MIILLVILGIVGILLSLYLEYVDSKVKKNKNYHAVCDITKTISCTTVAKSGYSHIFGVSNARLGIIYYILVILLSFYDVKFIFLLSIISIIMSGYLIYVSFFKIKKHCVVCYCTHILNALIFLISWVIL